MRKLQLITVKEYLKNVPLKERKRRDGEKGLKPNLKRFWEEWYETKRENPSLKFSNWKIERNKKIELEPKKEESINDLDKDNEIKEIKDIEEDETMQQQIKKSEESKQEKKEEEPINLSIDSDILSLIGSAALLGVLVWFIKERDQQKNIANTPKYIERDIGGGKKIKIPIRRLRSSKFRLGN